MVQGSQNTPGSELVPAPKQGGALSPLWYVGVALSVAMVSWYPLFGVMLLAGVARTIVDRGGHRALVGVVLAAVVPIVAFAAMLGLSQGLVLVPAAFTSLALATLMWRGRASVTAVSSVVVAGTLASLAVDAIILAGQGLGVAETTCGALLETVRLAAGDGVASDAIVSAAEPLVRALWPLVYSLTVMVNAVGAGIGAFVAAPRGTAPRRAPQLANFDAPLWSVAALALSILGMGASFADIPYADVVRTVSATVFMNVRIIFAAQGLGVLSSMLMRLRTGCMLRPLIICFAVWIEAMSFILSIVGLIDVWANFRKLARGGSDAEALT